VTRSPALFAGAVVLVVAGLAALAGALLAPAGGPDLSPSAVVLAVLRGLWTSAVVATLGTAGGLALGGALATFVFALPRRLEDGMVRVVTMLSAAPLPLFALVWIVSVRAARPSLPTTLAGLLDSRWVLAASIAVIEAVVWTRPLHGRLAVLRALALTLRARAPEVRRMVLLRRRLAPEAGRFLAVSFVLALPSALAWEGFFSYLGFGVEAPAVSLGTLIVAGAAAMSVAPWTLLLPALALLAVTISLRVVGAALQERTRSSRTASAPGSPKSAGSAAERSSAGA
jgi:ABC-type dipeptide/oligopeptide/nickel transport system permease subunit